MSDVYYVTARLGNGDVKVLEFVIVILFALTRLGRAEHKNNTVFTDFHIPFSKYGYNIAALIHPCRIGMMMIMVPPYPCIVVPGKRTN